MGGKNLREGCLGCIESFWVLASVTGLGFLRPAGYFIDSFFALPTPLRSSAIST